MGLILPQSVGIWPSRASANDPYANTYLHFNGGAEFFGFSPNFVFGVTEFRVVADIAALYTGEYNKVYIYDNATGPASANSKNFSLGIIKENGFANMNFKMNGNESQGIFNPSSVLIDERMLEGVIRGKVGLGAKSFTQGTLACYYEYNGEIISRGANIPFEQYGPFWGIYETGGPSIGWTMLKEQSYGIGKPSIFDLYSLEFYQNGVLTDRLVPAISSYNVACLWNEVRNVRWDWRVVLSGGEVNIHGPAKYVGV